MIMEDKWYKTEENSDWYSASPAPEPAPPPSGEKKEKRKGPRWLVILVVAALLISTAVSLFNKGGNPDTPKIEAPEETEAPSSEDGQKDRDWNSGINPFSGSFEDFFKQYYSLDESTKPCKIPRIEARKSLSVTLDPKGTEELSLQELYVKCSPFIVTICAYIDNTGNSYYFGTGVLFSSDGYIITNSHVVEGTISADVLLWDDSEYEAKLVGNDSRSDLAVLKIEGHNFPFCSFANSDTLRVGDEVIAIGNPIDSAFRSTMTNGIVTGIDRDVNYNGTSHTLIQTNAALNSGNSGGALINSCGQVVGITNMKYSTNSSTSIEGLGFAIPSTTVKDVSDSLIQHGKVTGSPVLGITVGPISQSTAEEYGVEAGLFVSKISAGSRAAEEGLMEGDILMTANGVKLTVNSDLLSLIADLDVGDTIDFTVFRPGKKGGGKILDITLTLIDVSEVYS